MSAILPFSKILNRMRLHQMQEDVRAEGKRQQSKAAYNLFETGAKESSEEVHQESNSEIFNQINYQLASELHTFSNDMSAAMVVVLDEVIAESPELEEVRSEMYNFLDEVCAKEEGQGVNTEIDNDRQPEIQLRGILVEKFGFIDNFKLYVPVYNYYLDRRRKHRKNHELSEIMDVVNELENDSTIDLVQGVKNLQSKTLSKAKLLNGFKVKSNNYNMQYMPLIETIEREYAQDYHKAIREALRLHSYNVATVNTSDISSYEQKAFLIENVTLETKMLQLLSIFCQLAPDGKRLSKQITGLNEIFLSKSLISMLDGFDTTRLLANHIKNLSTTETKKQISYLIVNSIISQVRRLPDSFFKEEKDRERLLERLQKYQFAPLEHCKNVDYL